MSHDTWTHLCCFRCLVLLKSILVPYLLVETARFVPTSTLEAIDCVGVTFRTSDRLVIGCFSRLNLGPAKCFRFGEIKVMYLTLSFKNVMYV